MINISIAWTVNLRQGSCAPNASSERAGVTASEIRRTEVSKFVGEYTETSVRANYL